MRLILEFRQFIPDFSFRYFVPQYQFYHSSALKMTLEVSIIRFDSKSEERVGEFAIFTADTLSIATLYLRDMQ